MARLYLFAEGRTEQVFANTVLNPHLASFGVYMQPPVLIAHCKKKHKVHRGGGRRYEPMKNDILRFLAQERSRDVFFTTMIDLYALHSDMPGRVEADGLKHLPSKRVEFLEDRWGEDIGDRRFIPFIQLHEFEAYLFADPNCFSLFYENCDREIAVLQSIAREHDTPELINDGSDTAPSKRIIDILPDYEDAKPIIGPQVAELIGLDPLQCRRTGYGTTGGEGDWAR